jgi:hypothetical protein
MRIVPKPNQPVVADRFIAYVQRFDIVPQVQPASVCSTNAKGPHPNCASGMYVLRRAKRMDHTVHTFLGDIVPLDQVRTLVELTPQFGEKADRRLTRANASAYCSKFWLDKYFTKDLFFALTLGGNCDAE